ncbi:hypothetical protein [Microcoleus sp. AT9b-C5]|uniref:hypothetical protein n=1 Tax=unclassified Microcoleus TaxID=2642155 RepID=UPI002FD10F1A
MVRRIDQLKALAYDCNLTTDEARKFGDPRATATWEKLLSAHGLEFDRKPEITSNKVASASVEAPHQINLIEWVDWVQALALALASVGFTVLVLGMFPRINPLNLFPVKITIQVGK